MGWLSPWTRFTNTPPGDFPPHLKTLRSAKLPPDLPADFIASGVSSSEASDRLIGTMSASACARPVRRESLSEPWDSYPHPSSQLQVHLSRHADWLFRRQLCKREKIRLLYSDACGIVSTYGIFACGDTDAAPSLTIPLRSHLPFEKTTPQWMVDCILAGTVI